MKNWANLDILRSMAVLIVMFGHWQMYTGHNVWNKWTGLTGVCLFFVHTCLVLMWSLEREPNTLRFYVRRAFRLYPLWLVVLATVVILRVPIAPPAAPGFAYLYPHWKEILANALLVMNLTPYGIRIVGASWSLPLEAQMYLLLPVLYFFIRAERRLWPLLVINVLAWASVWSVTPWTSVSQTLGTTLPYFLPGAMAYVLWKRVTPVLPAWSFPVVLLLLCAVHSRYGSLPLSAPFCLAVGLMLPYFRQVTWRRLVVVSHTIAKYSYGLYLCHIPAIWFAFHHLRGQSLLVRVLAFLIGAGLPSVILYHTVEQPAIRFGARLAARIAPGAPAQRPTPRTLEMEPAP